MEWICRHSQMAQLVAEEMRFELEWNSTSTTTSSLTPHLIQNNESLYPQFSSSQSTNTHYCRVWINEQSFLMLFIYAIYLCYELDNNIYNDTMVSKVSL